MEAVQASMQSAIAKMMEDLDRECIRKIQMDMHKCSITCCEDRTFKMDDVKRCTERCSAPLNQAREYVQLELTSFQDKFHQCAEDCQTKVRDKSRPGLTTDATVAKNRVVDFEQCLVKCGDQHVNLLPATFAQMKQVLQQTAKGKK